MAKKYKRPTRQKDAQSTIVGAEQDETQSPTEPEEEQSESRAESTEQQPTSPPKAPSKRTKKNKHDRKKKKQNKLALAKQKLASLKNRPASFRKLPHEIRLQVLYYSCEMTAMDRMLTNILSGAGQICDEMDAGKQAAIEWATVLREIHGDIIEDIDVVELKWMREYEHCEELLYRLGVPRSSW